jgi:aminoglycoside phosphotransferase (APT) family kinase protein
MVPVTTALARRLVRRQFPHWSDLPIRRIRPGGWDNRSFRLGEAMALRLPSAERYAAQVDKEQTWLPRLAPHLPLPIPQPLARGRPGEGYPFDWSVMAWIEGTPALRAGAGDPLQLARDLAAFLTALQRAPAAGGPAPGVHSFHRGGALAVYDAETEACIASMATGPKAEAMRSVWARALATRWSGPPVWVHGDVAPGNLLLREGRLAAVLDFGCSAVGDPACDLAIRWMWFAGSAAEAFRQAMPADAATWDRARGWALWKTLLGLRDAGSARAMRRHGRALAAILADA